jgi:hypothetical protein
MKKFKVGVIRTVYQFKELTIEAESLRDAEMMALDTAGNYEFSGEHSSDYEIDYSMENDK